MIYILYSTNDNKTFVDRHIEIENLHTIIDDIIMPYDIKNYNPITLNNIKKNAFMTNDFDNHPKYFRFIIYNDKAIDIEYSIFEGEYQEYRELIQDYRIEQRNNKIVEILS